MINRNNYEEYLLMYLDGELSSEDMRSVESFLESNPDIEEELLLLQQTILQPEEIEFPAKHTLYRKAEGISLGNYEEYFLLYVDNELPASEKESVETFVLQNPQLQDEFTLLKDTVLPKENIVFYNKELLYRKEEKKRPIVISLRWASLAAAAMIGLITLIIFNNGSEPNEIAVQEPKIQENKVQRQEQLPLPVVGDNSAVAYERAKNNSNKNVVRPLKQQEQKLVSQQPVIAYEQKTQEEQKKLAIVEPPKVIEYTGNTETVNTITEPEKTKVVSTTFTGVEEKNYTQHVVYTEDVESEQNNNLSIGALQINTDKVRGLFRKATRFLSKKVKNNNEGSDDKIQIANLEVKKNI
jgi:hypothetical protein